MIEGAGLEREERLPVTAGVRLPASALRGHQLRAPPATTSSLCLPRSAPSPATHRLRYAQPHEATQGIVAPTVTHRVCGQLGAIPS